MKLFTEIISGVFQPLLMPILALYLLFSYHSYFKMIYNPDFVNRLYVISLILVVVMPILSFLILYKWGIISDIKMTNRKERVLPTYVALVYYCCFYYLIRQIGGLDPIIISAIFGGILAILIANIITSYWKISIHGIGISLVAGIFVASTELKHVDHNYMVIGLIMLIGLVGFSRLYLKRHTPAQVYAGSAVGFLVPYLCITFGWYL
jgi:membrane-associated phospholipid phosphatase